MSYLTVITLSQFWSYCNLLGNLQLCLVIKYTAACKCQCPLLEFIIQRIGTGTVVIGTGTVVIGTGTVVIGTGTVVIGTGTVVIGTGTVVIGTGTVVIGWLGAQTCHAMPFACWQRVYV